MQHTTVARLSSIIRNRAELLKPPPGTLKCPAATAPSKAAQKPMNGPKENGKANTSEDSTPAIRKICDHASNPFDTASVVERASAV